MGVSNVLCWNIIPAFEMLHQNVSISSDPLKISVEDVKNKAEVHKVIIKFLRDVNFYPFNEKTGKKMFQKQGN